MKKAVKEKTKIVTENKNDLTTVLDNMLEGVQIISTDWRFIYVNNTAASYMKYSKEEILGSTVWELYPGFEKTKVFEAFKRSMEERIITQSELAFEFPDQSKGWFEIKIQPVEEGILVLAIDITERKKANEEITTRERMLAESQKVAHIGSWEWDINAVRLIWSDEMYRIFGLQPQELEVNYDLYLKYVHPEDREMVKETIGQVFKDHQDYDIHFRIVRPDGFVRIIHGQGKAVLKNGELIKLLGVGQDVTEQRLEQEKIEQNEQLLSESQKVGHVGSWEWNIADNKLTWSDELYRIYGLDPREHQLTYETFLKCNHPEDLELVDNIVRQAFKDHKDFNFYHRIIKPDGSVRIIHGQGSVVVKNGKPVKMRGIGQDVTERKNDEEKIKASEQLLSESQKAGHIGSWEWDIVQNKVTWSDELYRLFGLNPDEFEATYESYLQFAHPDDKEMLNNNIQQALKDRRNFDIYHRIKRPDNIVRILNGQGSVVVNNGEPVKMRGIAQDVTERKKAEEEVINQKKFTEAVLNNIPGDIVVFDKNHNYLFLNPREVSTPEFAQWLIGKNDFDYCRYTGFDDTVAHKRKQLFDEAVQSKADVEWIDEQQDNQGQTVYMLRKFHPVFNNDQLAYVIGYGVNITDLKTAEKKLEEAVKVAQSAFKEMEQFSYMVSHDLQEPLRMISGFLNLLKEETAKHLDDSAKEYIKYAVDGADRMKTLINDLLKFSKIRSDFQDFNLVNLNEVLQYVIHVQQFEIDKTNAQVTLKQLPVITANDALITQLFMNLIGNSIKYNKKENPQVEVGSTEDARKWTFYIKDNGIGIAPESLEKVFLIFERLHSRQEYSGTGIGLAICKKIVEKHGGSIWAESEPGKGSTFYFTIPKNLSGPSQN